MLTILKLLFDERYKIHELLINKKWPREVAILILGIQAYFF